MGLSVGCVLLYGGGGGGGGGSSGGTPARRREILRGWKALHADWTSLHSLAMRYSNGNIESCWENA